MPALENAPNASELRAFLIEKLPGYMIPSSFVSLSTLPLTPNGKVDRKALPAPDQTRPSLDRQYVPAHDAVERQLVSIWENVLGVHPIGIQDKFFDLGGHSMLAVRVIAQIEKAFDRKLRRSEGSVLFDFQFNQKSDFPFVRLGFRSEIWIERALGRGLQDPRDGHNRRRSGLK